MGDNDLLQAYYALKSRILMFYNMLIFRARTEFCCPESAGHTRLQKLHSGCQAAHCSAAIKDAIKDTHQIQSDFCVKE